MLPSSQVTLTVQEHLPSPVRRHIRAEPAGGADTAVQHVGVYHHQGSGELSVSTQYTLTDFISFLLFFMAEGELILVTVGFIICPFSFNSVLHFVSD